MTWLGWRKGDGIGGGRGGSHGYWRVGQITWRSRSARVRSTECVIGRALEGRVGGLVGAGREGEGWEMGRRRWGRGNLKEGGGGGWVRVVDSEREEAGKCGRK